MKATSKKILALVLLVVPFALVMYLSNYPLRNELEGRIVDSLTEMGASDIDVEISTLTQNTVTFSRFGFRKDDYTILAEDVRINATSLPYRELIQKNYANITADWTIGGLTINGVPSLALPKLSGSGNFFMQEGTSPVLKGSLEDAARSHTVTFNISPKQALLEAIKFRVQKYNISADRLNATFATPLGEGPVAADWTVSNAAVTGMKYDLPALSGGGKFTMKDDKPVVTGRLADKAKTHQGNFTVTSKTALLENVRVSAYNAKLRAGEVVIHLSEKKPIYVPLEVSNLDLGQLLDMITGEKASGTGTVNGKVELMIYPDGRFEIGGGGLGTVGDGMIRLDPTLLPGDNQQLAEARLALSNFHYENVSITSSEDANGRTAIHLKIEGNNPEAFDGRPIKLNVNLTGDVLELLQQTILPMANPTEYLK